MEVENFYYLTALFHWVVLLHCHKLQLRCGDLPWRNLWSLSKICPFHADLWLSVNYSLTVQLHDLNTLIFFLFSFLQQLLTAFCFRINCNFWCEAPGLLRDVLRKQAHFNVISLLTQTCSGARLSNRCFLKPLETGHLLYFFMASSLILKIELMSLKAWI